MREIPIRAVILFGSYARGNPKNHSDIDLAIISDWFKGKTRIESLQYLSRLAVGYNTLIEAIPFTTEEYNEIGCSDIFSGCHKNRQNVFIRFR